MAEHMVSDGGVVIYNPTAGRGQGGVVFAQAKQMLGAAFEWRPTQRAGHARELAEAAAKEFPLIVACGGDGTVGDVARGILKAGTDATLAVIPVGTGNDFARNLGLSLDLREATSTVLSGIVRRIDIGYINGTPFINNCGTGFDAQVMIAMNSSIRFTRGQFAFLLAIMKTLGPFKPFTLTFSADNGKLETEKVMMVSVLNGRVYGGGMLAAPKAEMDDGLMDVMIIRALPKAKLLALLPRVLSGSHENHPGVRMLRVRKINLTTMPTQPLNIDGDVQGLTPAEITVDSRVLKVLVR